MTQFDVPISREDNSSFFHLGSTFKMAADSAGPRCPWSSVGTVKTSVHGDGDSASPEAREEDRHSSLREVSPFQSGKLQEIEKG